MFFGIWSTFIYFIQKETDWQSKSVGKMAGTLFSSTIDPLPIQLLCPLKFNRTTIKKERIVCPGQTLAFSGWSPWPSSVFGKPKEHDKHTYVVWKLIHHTGTHSPHHITCTKRQLELQYVACKCDWLRRWEWCKHFHKSTCTVKSGLWSIFIRVVDNGDFSLRRVLLRGLFVDRYHIVSRSEIWVTLVFFLLGKW